MSNRCAERAEEVVNDFESVADWESRYRHVIAAGKVLAPLTDEEKSGARFLIEGCISRAWLVPEKTDGTVVFRADSEAAIVKGILGLLVRVYSDATPQEILSQPADFLEKIGLFEHLSMNRRNGLSQVLRQIQLYATVYAAQEATSAKP